MEINDFSDLSSFISDENLKMQETYGVNKPSDKMVKFCEKNILKYAKLYDKPLYKKEQRKIALEMAIDAMPHGFIWKLFHYDLWRKIKALNKKQQKANKNECSVEKSQTLLPDIVKSVDVPKIVDEEEF